MAAAAWIAIAAGGAHADILVPASPLTFTPHPADLSVLNHQDVYTWRIDNINLGSEVVTGAQLTIKNIANWDSGPNMLFVHLLDSAKSAGVATFVDDPSSNTTENEKDIVDDFANPRYHSQPNWLVAPGTADTFLTSKSFTTIPTTFTYTFTAAQLQALDAYILDGHNIALGLDPDCHFFDDGVTLTIFTATVAQPQTVPEPASVLLLGFGATALLIGRRYRTAGRSSHASSAAGVAIASR
ncbi:MAG TPA: PEP-CTERM sorting domain-containing protein [Isosphaeraceae bacterium]